MLTVEVPEDLLGDLYRVGYLHEAARPVVVPTQAGEEAYRETLQTGRVPLVVWLDPADVRQAIWTAVRIHVRVAVPAVLASGVESDAETVRAYLDELAELGVLVRRQRREEWILVEDPGPIAPRLDEPATGERSAARAWPSRVRLAASRLGRGGGGFTSADLEAAAGVDGKLCFAQLEHWETLGHVVRVERLPLRDTRGMAWWWSLTSPGSLDDAPEAGVSGWRQTIWDRLCSGERLSEDDAADVTGSALRARTYLRGLVDAGLARRTRGGLHQAPKSLPTPYPKGSTRLRAVR